MPKINCWVDVRQQSLTHSFDTAVWKEARICYNHSLSPRTLWQVFLFPKCGRYQQNTIGLELWCLTPLSTIFQLYRSGMFYWWRKPSTCPSHWQTGFQFTTLVIISLNCTCSCKSNYHTIMTMTTPPECNNRLLNTIINNIFVIPWNPVLLTEETRVPQKK